MLRDRLVAGLRDKGIQHVLLAKTDTTYKVILDAALVAEAASKDVSQLGSDGNNSQRRGSQFSDKEAKPIFMWARQVPFAWRTKVEQELNRLHQLGVIEPVRTSKWATPVVPVAKPDESVHLCGDYRCIVNREAIKVDVYPLLAINNILASLSGGKMKRLPFGVSSCPAICQREMEKIVRGIPGTTVMIDDILVMELNEEALHQKLRKIFNRISEAGLKLNKSKCLFKTNQLKFLGYLIDAQGIQPTPNKIAAIQQGPRNKQELQAFFGFVNFYDIKQLYFAEIVLLKN
ncbi:uncharacterized protein K02A2.6-like [Centruroides sculpturatus]|uniref:uncharacterized protein K02A2.6-like n=1 Tax=Centruroides sculpturatus TaxID=218467 RepID=UPI000C6EBDE7|nr:uncharacterized protein K02A2.6-like [Centruroides sculpturatus]